MRGPVVGSQEQNREAAVGPEEPGAWSNLGVAAILVVAGLLGRRWA